MPREDYEDDDYEDEDIVDEEEKARKRMVKCIRAIANMSHVKPTMLLDTKVFNVDLLRQMIPSGAPKIVKLFQKIAALDAKDMRTHKKVFKHMIFTDANSSNYGAKLLASAFIAYDFTPVFTNKLTMKSDDVLLETKGKNFGLLLSKAFAGKSMSVKFKKEQMHKYNERPVNGQGDLMRFIILDQGFKEGIDLYDVKYVHLFEPLVSRADEKQAIGRGTRFCGQKGLEFHPRVGWPLYVFRYDVAFKNTIQDTKTMFELFLKHSNIDMRRVIFANEVESAVIDAAVDKSLTAEIHSFKVEAPSPILSASAVGGGRGAEPPRTKLGYASMQNYVATRFKDFKYPKVKLENMCNGAGGNGKFVDFTPTQDFIRHFFQPSSAYNGMLLFHSVGSGKTCTAIATATSSFEKEGYNIMWVTRHTLKSDIWKNMYGQMCSLTLKERIEKGELKLPKDVSNPMKHLSDRWMEPMSYKQFSNMLKKDNKFYDEIVRRNGKIDPLRKTLVIIDEAHKLYAANVVGSEKPDTEILEKMIDNSYKVSGKNSCRVLLMTATPYTSDGMEMIKLLNLLRPAGQKIPNDFDAFAGSYLDKNGYFTKKGRTKFMDQVSGYVSYLNRSQDARYFAHPVIENVYAEMSPMGKPVASRKHDKEIKAINERIKELRAEIKGEKALVKDNVKKVRDKCKEEQKERLARCKEDAKNAYDAKMAEVKEEKEGGLEACKELPVKERKGCKDEVQESYKKGVEGAKAKKVADLDDCNKVKEACVMDKETKLGDVVKKSKELAALVAEAKAMREAPKKVLKEFSEGNKAAVEALKPLKVEAKGLRESKKLLASEIRDLKEREKREKNTDARTALREQLKNKRKEMKALTNDINEVRTKIVNLTSNKKIARINVGRGVIGDVSQEKALFERCFKVED